MPTARSPRASSSSSSPSRSRCRERRSSPGRACAGSRGRASGMADGAVAVVVVTYNALPWLEPCLASVAGYETVVVDHGSTDGTLDLLRGRFPHVRVLDRENRGLAAGWNAGVAATSA